LERTKSNRRYADLVGARAVNDPTATNLVRIVLAGSANYGSEETGGEVASA